ncbi:phage antirepressor [Salinicoccus sesuvii]|uniref:Phage antirepressor n=1 Tax=Salinicoccus sesuvii TaxID=868281 RepID=A0ABV7N4V0_9STAP
MNELKIFDFENQNVRTVVVENVPYFVGKDVADVLGYTRPDNAIRKHVDDEDKLMHQISASGQNRNMTLINESGLYSLIFSSKLDSAKRFKRWVTSEVLPDIRKHGMHATPHTVESMLSDPDTAIQLLENYKQEKHQRLIAEQRLKELEPKATYYDIILKNKSLITMTSIAKDYGMSSQAMNKLLNELGVQYKQSNQWFLYAKYQDKGYTSSEPVEVIHSDGTTSIKMNTKWTQKGRLFLYVLLKDNEHLPMIEQEVG